MAEFNMKTYIYVLKDPETLDIRYVGKTTCLKRRFKSHKCLKATKGTHLSSWIVSLRNKGLLPLMETVDIVEGAGWREKESYYIEFYKNQGFDLVNLTSGGEGCEGYKHTDEARKKMSDIQKTIVRTFIPSFSGNTHKKESKNKISSSQMGKNNHNYGKNLSEETRLKISKVLGKEIEINGIKYVSLREAARQLNMIWATFKYRYNRGLKLI